MASSLKYCFAFGLMVCTTAIGMTGCGTSSNVKLSDLQSLQQRADAAYAGHHWKDAADAYKALADKVSGNAAYWFRLGNCYARLDELLPAIEAYRAALQRDPRIAPAWHNLGAVLLKQSQAAFQEAAANAKPVDPLQRESALLAERVNAVRKGMSSTIAPSAPAVPGGTTTSQEVPVPAASTGSGLQGAGR